MMGASTYPFPEIVCPATQTWVTRDNALSVVLPEKKTIATSLASSQESLAIRSQLLGLLKWSQYPYPVGVMKEILAAVEMCRVSILLEQMGLDITDGGITQEDSLQLIEVIFDLMLTGQVGSAKLLEVLGRLYLHKTKKLALIPYSKAQNLVQKAIDRLSKDLTFENAVAVAQYLQSQLRVRPSELEAVLVYFQGLYGIGYSSDNNYDISWGHLKIEEPELLEHLPRHRFSRRWSSRDTGSYLRRPDRLISDQSIFAYSTRLPSGSLLIDASGSMGDITSTLCQIIDLIPSVLIAAYGGDDDRGYLRVVARNGRCVPKIVLLVRPGRGMNVVDGPALQWLTRQAPPRIWVSDGHVTGIGDQVSGTLRNECQRICSEGDIVRVQSLQESISLFGKHAQRRRVRRTYERTH